MIDIMGVLEQYANQPPAGMERLTITVPTGLAEALRMRCQTLGLSVDEAVRRLIEHEVTDRRGATPGNRRARYLSFWTLLLSEMGRNRVPLPQNWFSFPLGQAGITADAVFTAEGRLRVCCVIHRRRREENVAIFQHLTTNRSAIESEWGTPLNWEAREGQLASRICDETTGAIEDEDQWPDLAHWIKLRIQRMETVFRPRIADLDHILRGTAIE